MHVYFARLLPERLVLQQRVHAVAYKLRQVVSRLRKITNFSTIESFNGRQKVSPPLKTVGLWSSDVDTAEERGLIPGETWGSDAGRKLSRQRTR